MADSNEDSERRHKTYKYFYSFVNNESVSFFTRVKEISKPIFQKFSLVIWIKRPPDIFSVSKRPCTTPKFI